MKGDPAIRGHVFQQCRIQSRLDDKIDMILPVLEELVLENGVFHLKIHFSSSRATIWLLDDPYRYQLLEYDDLIDPDVCLAFPHKSYPPERWSRRTRCGPSWIPSSICVSPTTPSTCAPARSTSSTASSD